MGMPPLVHFLDIMSLLGYVSPTCASLPCHASFAAASARVVLAVHGRMRTLWVWSMSLLGYVSPTCASLPCHASFAAASEFGWARVVLAVHAPAA